MITSLSTIGHDADVLNAKREQIVQGARRVFLELGYDASSMGEIARASGVSKGTLYTYFANKSILFEAIVEVESAEQRADTFNFDPTREIDFTLREFGRDYLRLLCRPGGGAAIRTVLLIAERMPEVGRQFYERVLAENISQLAAYLSVRTEPDKLSIDDQKLAASQFMMMCQATLFMPFVFQAAPAPSPQRIEAVVESAARVFLAAYRMN